MTDIEWGAEIAVHGKRPEWWSEGPTKRFYQNGAVCEFDQYCYINWDRIEHIRLPATHDYYKATSHGFTYWPGGESAPEDCGKEALMRYGGNLSGNLLGCRWDHVGNSADIIGYRKRTERPAPAIAPELVERMVRLVKLCRDVICAGPYANEARAILAELEPDPDLTLAKSIVGDAEAIALAIKAARENGRG